MNVLEPVGRVRQDIVSQLTARLAEPGFQIICVSGDAGVGKSHLIREVLQGTTYIAGKFDTGKDTTLAYAAFIQAIRKTLNQLLSLPDQAFKYWQAALQRDVPLAALVHVLPELAYFQGPEVQHSLRGVREEMLLDTLSLTRPFERAFLKLWQCLTESGREPNLSLIWLDDVQWMDEASTAFLEFLLEQDLPVRWILTGRDTRAVEALLHSLGIPKQTQVCLEPFSEREVQAFVQAELGCPREDSQELASFLYRLSYGFPLELTWGIKELVQQQKIVYQQGWQYTGQISELVSGPYKGWGQLMSHQWQRLPAAVQELLSSAALLGPKFSLQNLRQVLLQESEIFADDWIAALDSGFLAPSQGDEGQFSHDRLYEWVLQSLKPGHKIERQLQIARQLLRSGQAPLELLVELLNASRLFLDPDEQHLRQEKNLLLIRAMLSQGAIGQARQLLHQITQEIGPDSSLFNSCQILRASQAYLANEMVEAEAILHALLQTTDEDVLDAQLLLIVIYTQHNRYHEAVIFALELLAAQGLEISREPEQTGQVFQRSLQGVQQMPVPELLACADMPSSAVYEAQMRVIATVAVAIYNYDLELYSACVLYALDQILQGQGTSCTASIYGAASLLLFSHTGELEPALKLIQVAEQLARQTGRDDELTLIHCVMGDMIAPWKMSFATARDYLISSREAGSRSGNLQFAGYACVFRGANLFLCAHPLVELGENILPELIHFNRQTQNLSPLDGLQAYGFLIEKLRFGQFQTPEQTEHEFIADLRQRESRADLSRYFTYKAFVLLIFGDIEAAYAAFQQSELDIYLPSSIVRVWHLLLKDLLHWRLQRVAPDQARPLLPFNLETLARINPDNFESLYQIWLAEQPSRTPSEKIHAYHQAVIAARGQGHWHWEGFALEQIAHIQQHQGLDLLAQQSLVESMTAYQRWGASAKVQQLAEKLKPDYQIQYSRNKQYFSHDVVEILRVCAEFSKILSPEALQHYILQVLKNQTQAEQIELLFKPDEGAYWRCVTLSEQYPERLQDSRSQVPQVLLNYVSRTHQSVVLPAHREIFSSNEIFHLDGQHLLLPLVFQQTLMGIIYLQPRTQSTFFGFQVEMLLQALGGYLAGALHNAQRSQNLENLIALHTADLQKANLRLSQLLEERQEVLAIAAHDLKHPLGTLKLGLSMLEQMGESLPPGMRKKAFENLNQTLDDMNHNTERLLMIEHLETDILQPQWKKVQLSEALKPFLQSYEWKAREKNQQLVFTGFQQDALVDTDPGMLKMILNNLLENAIKFSPFTTHIQVELHLDATHFVIKICDQGPGLNKADQQRLFQKFGRLSARPTAGESSHGLGLFIVRRLVDDLHGQIQVESLPKQGCTFWVRFCRQREWPSDEGLAAR